MRLPLALLLLMLPLAAEAMTVPVPRPDVAGLALRPGPDDPRPATRPWRPDGVLAASPRPADKPRLTRHQKAWLGARMPLVDAGGKVRISAIPMFKPLEAIRNAVRRRDRTAPEAVPGGGLCGRPTLVGERIGAVPGNGACGIADAVRVRSVAGIALSTPARMDCDTAVAFDAWVRQAAIPAFGARDRLVSMRMASAYSCRRIAGSGKLSEHGRGRAVDISAFGLASGRTVTLIDGWTSDYGQILRQVHRAACGPFKTVLGPDANRAHRDHFHFDMARRRSGQSYCR